MLGRCTRFALPNSCASKGILHTTRLFKENYGFWAGSSFNSGLLIAFIFIECFYARFLCSRAHSAKGLRPNGLKAKRACDDFVSCIQIEFTKENFIEVFFIEIFYFVLL